jgi:hypothetical protein
MIGTAALAHGRTSDLRLLSVGTASTAIEPVVPRLLAAFDQLSATTQGAS